MQDVIQRFYANANNVEDQRQIMGDVLNMEQEARGTEYVVNTCSAHIFRVFFLSDL
jgi:hypothetical protein